MGAVDFGQFLWPDVSQGRQPQTGAAPNPRFSFRSLLLPSAFRFVDVSGNDSPGNWAPSGTVTPTIAAFGAANYLNSSGSFTNTTTAPASTPCTWVFVGVGTNSTSNYVLGSVGNLSASSPRLQFDTYSGKPRSICVNAANSASVATSTAAALANGEPFVAVFTVDQTGAPSVFFRGIKTSAASPGGTISGYTGMKIGDVAYNGSPSVYAGSIGSVAIIPYVIDDATAKFISLSIANAWMTLFAPQQLFVPFGTGGGGAVWSVSMSESCSAADSIGNALAAAVSMAESGAATDTVSTLAQYVAAISEAGSASDATTAAGALIAAIAESGAAADTSNYGSSTISVAMAESGAAADVASALALFGAAVAETGAAADASTVSAILAASLAESGAAADIANWGGSTISAAISEAGSATDAAAVLAVFAVAALETGAATDSTSAKASFLAAMTEAGSAADMAALLQSYTVAIAEAGNAVDMPWWVAAVMALSPSRLFIEPIELRTFAEPYESRTWTEPS